MKENRQYNRGGTIQAVGAFTLGAALGSIVALLFAPASGRVTRKRIGMKFRSLQRSTARQLGQAQRVLAKKAGYLREAATEKLQDARKWVVGHVISGNGRRPRRLAHHA